jgi:hypothetical protein
MPPQPLPSRQDHRHGETNGHSDEASWLPSCGSPSRPTFFFDAVSVTTAGSSSPSTNLKSSAARIAVFFNVIEFEMVRRLNDYVSMMRSHCSPNRSEIAKDGWLAYARPGGAYWAPKLVRSLWKAKEIFITENGCASDDVVADDGKVYDTDRIMFLRSQLEQLQRATADGVPVKGFFQ